MKPEPAAHLAFRRRSVERNRPSGNSAYAALIEGEAVAQQIADFIGRLQHQEWWSGLTTDLDRSPRQSLGCAVPRIAAS
jgi:hypothetical protein